MTPNYRFPSQIKVDLSEIEKPLRRVRMKKTDHLQDLIDIFLVAVGVGLIVGIVLTLMMLFRSNGVQAATDDRGYCAKIEQEKWPVVGASEEEVSSYCASL